jgi:transcriptional regulator with XRE-family HTH domain
MIPCISIDRYSRIPGVTDEEGAKAKKFPYAGEPWARLINRLLKAEKRPDPRPKPDEPTELKYWNQTDLAAAAEMGGNTVTDIMRGARRPSLESLEAIARVLGQPVFLFLMPADEAERYQRFREAKTADDSVERHRKLANQIVAELAPDIAELIERRLASPAPPIERPEIVRPTKAVKRRKHA